MKKLSLDLDDMALDSFETVTGDEKPRGTVRAHASDVTSCITWDYETCHWSCQQTCGDSCGGTCVFETCYNPGCGPSIIIED